KTMRARIFLYSGMIVALAGLSACQQQNQAQNPPAAETPAAAENAAPAENSAEGGLPPALSGEANAKYLADNKAKEGVKTTADGLQYRVITAGTGDSAKGPADHVQVFYKGSLIDGTVFDQTMPGEPPVDFAAGNVIHGWVEALSMMKVGDVWE